MFLRWLLQIFPVEMSLGWRLVRPDLLLWVALSGLLAVASITLPPPGKEAAEVPLLPFVIFLGAGLITTMLPSVLFTAQLVGRQLTWGPVLGFVARRAPALVAYVLCAVLVSYGAASAIRVSISVVLAGTPMMLPVATLVATVVLLSLLVRFSFLPFLVILSSREEIPPEWWQWPRAEALSQVFWPLPVRARLTDGYRWRLVPYTALGQLLPWLVPLAGPELTLPISIIGQVVLLLIQGVLFDYYCVRGEQAGIPAPKLPDELLSPPDDEFA